MRILHITHDPKWFQDHFNYLCQQLGHEGDTFVMPQYDSTEAIANDIWNKNKDYFNSFDAVYISHVANGARPFLQNGWDKPLYLWLLFRLDYGVGDINEYLKLLREARLKPNVKIFAGSESDKRYAEMTLGNPPIDVVLPLIFINNEGKKKIDCDKDDFYLMHKQNEGLFESRLHEEGIPVYKHDWSLGAPDLRGIKGIIHFPYVGLTRGLYENLALENVYFLPSLEFFNNLRGKAGYFWDSHGEQVLWRGQCGFELTEWYKRQYLDLFVYFSSFEELKGAVERSDLDCLIAKKKKNIRKFKRTHNDENLEKWRKIFS